MKEPSHIVDEATKARAAEAQTTASPARKVLAEFVIQNYPDAFNGVMKEVRKIPGILPGHLAAGYITAVALNLASIPPVEGAKGILAKLYGEMLEREILQIWEDFPNE